MDQDHNVSTSYCPTWQTTHPPNQAQQEQRQSPSKRAHEIHAKLSIIEHEAEFIKCAMAELRTTRAMKVYNAAERILHMLRTAQEDLVSLAIAQKDTSREFPGNGLADEEGNGTTHEEEAIGKGGERAQKGSWLKQT
ncbi:hypothetical protein VTJ49DRAFT_3214 [Mycothermus thermophilus]|uniref:Uncharacterized protein n=1 Tax=Humicola insolens TaxID=85995 RepID=A0ABR3VNE2_HUMIN